MSDRLPLSRVAYYAASHTRSLCFFNQQRGRQLNRGRSVRAPFLRAGSTCGCAPAAQPGGSGFESHSALHPGPGTPESGITPFSFSCLTAGKDLPPRRVKTLAMRKSATHDSSDRRPAVRTHGGNTALLGRTGVTFHRWAVQFRQAPPIWNGDVRVHTEVLLG